MAVRAMSVLPCGFITVDKSVIIYRHSVGEKIKFPVSAVLLRTDGGYLLFDTGFHPNALREPEKYLGSHAQGVTFQEEDLIVNRLAELKVNPEDIRWVITSHLHFDHTGGNCYFKNAKFFVQRREYQYAFHPDPFLSSPFNANNFADTAYQLVEGSQELFPGIFLFTSPGHTVGHQSLIVELPGAGYHLLAGDAGYCDENVENKTPASNCYSPVEAVDTLLKLDTLAKILKGRLLFTHDYRLFEKVKPAPYWYE